MNRICNINKNISCEARDLAGPQLRSELITMRSNISSLEEAFQAISAISEGMVKRSLEETNDMAGLSRELASLSNNTVLSLLEDEGMEGLARKNLYYRASKYVCIH